MRCPNCRKYQKYHNGMYCTSCGYGFVIDPKEFGFSDYLVKHAVGKVSNNGTYFFTENQLYAFLIRKRKKRVWLFLITFPLLLLLLLYVFKGFEFGGIAFFTFITFFIHFTVAQRTGMFRKRPTRRSFEKILEHWKISEFFSDKLIEKPSLHSPPEVFPEKDIYDYGVEKILVLDRDILVDLLVLNDFHANNRTLVLSLNGYPEYLWQHAYNLLVESPDMPIYFAHDYSPTQPDITLQFRKKFHALTSERELIDLGLHEVDIQTMRAISVYGKDIKKMGIPIDFFDYGKLSGLLTQALEEGKPFCQCKAFTDDDSYCSFG